MEADTGGFLWMRCKVYMPRRPGGETGLVVGLMTEMYGGSKRQSREDVENGAERKGLQRAGEKAFIPKGLRRERVLNSGSSPISTLNKFFSDVYCHYSTGGKTRGKGNYIETKFSNKTRLPANTY